MTGRLAIMGSGETAPTMIKPHRALFAAAGPGPAVLLDTPYGFQENAEEISTKAQAYFRDSVGQTVDVLSWRQEPPAGIGREQALTQLRGARWVFAGPGSPTYALRQWQHTPVPRLLAEHVETGGVLTFASAAALTLGSHTIPVYEIYKAGQAPGWIDGLDLVQTLTGLPAVVIPHYDNAEGGHHDTRFCYLGERRLSAMEATLPAESFVLGVDEHTGCVLDVAARTATVVGNGLVTVRRHGISTTFSAGAVVSFDDLRSGGQVARSVVQVAPTAAVVPVSSLRADADAHEADFVAALAASDADRCVSAALALEQSIVDWSADSLTSDEGDHARGLLRSMVVRLGGLAQAGPRDPRAAAAPYVEVLLELRAQARVDKDFASSDQLRDRLTAAGVEIRDTPDGQDWSLRE